MKCLFLAAGYATRLYPLTENFPKPLLEVQGKSILDWLIGDLKRGGDIDQFIAVSNHKFAHHFQEWSERLHGGSIPVIDDGTTANENRIGAVRDIALAIDTCKLDEELLVVAGDNLLDFSLQTFLDYTRRKKTSCVMRYWEADTARLRKSGIATIDENDRIISMTEKPAEPASNWCCPPFYYFVKEDVAKVKEGLAAGCGYDAPGSYIAWLSTVSPVHAMEMPGRRYDIGNLESYEFAQRSYHAPY